jgi:hypothetical protein
MPDDIAPPGPTERGVRHDLRRRATAPGMNTGRSGNAKIAGGPLAI